MCLTRNYTQNELVVVQYLSSRVWSNEIDDSVASAMRIDASELREVLGTSRTPRGSEKGLIMARLAAIPR